MRSPLEVLRLYGAHDYTLPCALASREAAGPDRPFLIYEGKTWSWREFGAASDGLARALLARGVKQGDRVAIMARNSEAHALLLMALARLRAIMVPVNPEFGVEEARYVLHHAEVSAVVAGGETLTTAQQAANGLSLPAWFAVADREHPDTPTLAALIATAPAATLPAGVTATDTCLIIYTSGTTGFPKGAMHSQASFLTGGEAFVQRVHLQDTDRVMIVLPMFHMNALFYTLAGSIAAGCSAVIMPRFSASRFWQFAVDHGATETNVIEAMGTILQARPRSEFRPEHRIRAVYGVRGSFADTFRNEFHVRDLVSGYGMTEIPGVTCTPFEGPSKPGSMGMVGRHPDPARPWAECRVVDDEGREVPAGEVGEMWVKTPIVMQGYFRDPEQTHAAFHDGWFKTGDLVRRDADGFFFFVSRKKDIIRRRGENIAGAELDRVIGSHPAVLEVAAIAVPAELGEDDILAAIVKRPDLEVTADEIARWCKERLAPQKVPRYVLFLDALPHTPTHKIAKGQLRQDTSLKQRAVDTSALAQHS
ncbi:MAG: AMP-binding protein [Alphaproteobacteria bacterium]|nr:AMP-binding protein [Alphaproteobacteria bacterium]